MTRTASLINPGPAVTPASNPHRAGSPNTQQSGENPMVGTIPAPARATVDAVRTRLGGQSYRFLTATKRGLAVNIDALTELVAEIVTEHTVDLAERCAVAHDVIYDLERELRTHQGGAR